MTGRFLTARRVAESETRRLAEVVAPMSDVVVITDRDLRLLHVNAAAEHHLGVHEEDVEAGRHLDAFVDPGDRPLATDLARRAVAGEALPHDLQLRLRRADGSTFDGALDLVAVRDAAGEVCALATIVKPRLAAEEEAAVLHAVVGAAAEGIVGLDEQGRVLIFSPAAERIYGFSAEEVVGQPVAMLVPEHRQDRLAEFLALLAEGKATRRYALAYRKDGTEAEIVVSAQPMLDSAGRPHGAAVVVLDVSERHRVQRLLERIVELSPTAILIKDCEGRYQIVNEAGARIIGREPKEIVGRVDAELFDEDAAAQFVAGDREVLAHREPMTVQQEVAGRHFVTTKFPIPGALDGFDGVGMVSTDVTDIRCAEYDRARLAALVQSAPDAIIAQDREGRIATWNPGAEAMFGIPAEQAIGRDYAETIVPPADRESFYADREQVRSGRTITKCVRRMRADGSIFPARVSAAAVTMPDGLWSGTLAMIRDVTDLAAAEAELEARAAQLERSNADLERFAYAASHDLQEPLQSIKLSASAVIDAASDRLDDDERELLSFVDAAASRLSGQIRGLMEVARVTLGAGPEERVPVEVAVQDALDVLRAAAERASAQIDVHRPLPDALIPRTELSLVLQNLVANSIKFHRRDVPPRVTISGSVGDKHVEVRVADNGVGLSAADRARVFGAFERVDASVPGTGMGLATAQRLVERHGGSISAASAGPGRGSEFTIRMPTGR